MEKKIRYDNRTFILGTAGKYYFGRVKGKSVSLHRYKYQKEIGPIPEGWHVHHVDGDCFNNSIENLQAISQEDHAKLHPTSKETLKKWHQAGIKAAPEWHASPEGMKWHYNHYDNIKAKLHEKIIRACCNCGKEVGTNKKNINVFCTNACKSAWRRKNKPDMKMKPCETCGKEYETRKYLPTRFCSKECKPAPNPLGFYARKNITAQ